MKLALRLIPAMMLLLIAVMIISGCAYFETGAAAAVDGVKYYCANNPTQAGRDLIRQGLHAEAVAEILKCAWVARATPTLTVWVRPGIRSTIR